MNVKQLIGRRINKLRSGRGMTQESLAEIAGISSKYLSRIERGTENPSLNVLIKVAECLDVSVYEIFQATEVKDPEKQKHKIDSLLEKAGNEQLNDIYRVLSLIVK